MAGTMQFQTSLDTGLECGVCNESFSNEGQFVPKVLYCGHTVCQSCSRRLFEHSRRGMKCPYCRFVTRLSDYSYLKRNFALIEVLGKVDSADKIQDLQDVVNRYRTEVEQTKGELQKRDKHLKEANARILETSWKNNKLSTELDHLQETVSKLDTDLMECRKEVKYEKLYSQQIENTYKEQIAHLENQVKALQQDLVRLQTHYQNILNLTYYRGLSSNSFENVNDYESEAEVLFNHALYRLNRKTAHLRLSSNEGIPKTVASLVIQYKGMQIQKTDLSIVDQIGSGSYGNVFLALWNGTVVAVKEMRRPIDFRRKANLALKEFTEMCKISHPCLVQYFSTFDGDDRKIGFVMEYMEMSLSEAIHVYDDFVLTEEMRACIIRQVCSGVRYLHGLGIVHGNLKTSNVLVNRLGDKLEVKLSDFGLSLLADTKSDGAEMLRYVQVNRYSAPEVVRGDLLTAPLMSKADIYSAALVFYEVVVNDEPFNSMTLSNILASVSKHGFCPEITTQLEVLPSVLNELKTAWCYFPEKRMITDTLAEIDRLYHRRKRIFRNNELLVH